MWNLWSEHTRNWGRRIAKNLYNKFQASLSKQANKQERKRKKEERGMVTVSRLRLLTPMVLKDVGNISVVRAEVSQQNTDKWASSCIHAFIWWGQSWQKHWLVEESRYHWELLLYTKNLVHALTLGCSIIMIICLNYFGWDSEFRNVTFVVY